ncbi:WD40/YVTN/BNR-like repeat-containing protein [Halolamina salina]|uniref:WD40/YVTN/BNR-like repeat-containing protein n=1 Tax=Halolamina salina TaxID=1220023 RepID=A0ABD6B4E0_9EURY
MSTAYAAYEDALFVVDADRGTIVREQRFDSRPECVAVADGAVLVGTFEHGLQRSTDAGASWERADGIEQDAVTSLAVDPNDPATVYAGTEPSRLYRSTDGGRTFERLPGLTDLPSSDEWSFPPRPDTHHVRWIEPDPNDPGLLHVAVEAGALLRARVDADGSVDWTDRVPSGRRDVHTIATHPGIPDHAWVAAGDGYAESTDAGESWRHPQDGLDHTYCWSVAVGLNTESTARSPPRVLLSAAASAREAHRVGESYLYRRDDGTWERLDGRGIPTGEGVYRAVIERGTDEATFWAANNHGLYRTANGGDAWTEIDVSWPDRVSEQTCRGLTIVD